MRRGDALFRNPIVRVANQYALFAAEMREKRDEIVCLTVSIDEREWRNNVNAKVLRGGAADLLK